MQVLFFLRQQVAYLSVIFGLSLSFASQAALVGRDLDGNAATFEAVYDDVLNITWLANANLAKTNKFGVSGIKNSGKMNWNTTHLWVQAINNTDYLGVNNWRLPTMDDSLNPDCLPVTYADGVCGYNVKTVDETQVYSELATMYYDNFQATAFKNPDGSTNSADIFGIDNANNTAYLELFNNLKNDYYWTGVESAVNGNRAWVFDTLIGVQWDERKTKRAFVWVVADGDVTVVPLPMAGWLFISGIIGLFSIKVRCA